MPLLSRVLLPLARNGPKHGKMTFGAPVACYVTMHTLACLTRQGAEALARKLTAAEAPVKARRIRFNLQEGKMLVEFDAPDRETLERWLKTQGFHFDWLVRLEFEAVAGSLQPVE